MKPAVTRRRPRCGTATNFAGFSRIRTDRSPYGLLRVGRSPTTAAPCKVSCLARPAPNLCLFFYPELTRTKLRSNRAERSPLTLRTLRKEGSGSRHGRIEDRTKSKKDALGSDSAQSCRSYQRVGTDGYGQPWAFSFHSAACSGSGLALTACGTGMGANGALQRDEVGLSSLPNSPSSDRRGATIRNASTSISSVEI